MPARPTANKFSKSVGGSLKSLIGGSGRTYFTIEMKTPTTDYRAGQVITFTSDYVEIGRSPKCALRFNEQNTTVSGKHTAITKVGDRYKVIHLSQTNPTLINGRPIKKEWFLENGDEIQLSLEGPRLSFLTPQNNVVGSLPLSIRMKAFTREALRPYRQAVTALAMIILAMAGVSGYFLYDLSSQNEYYRALNEQSLVKLSDQAQLSEARLDSIREENSRNTGIIGDLHKEVSRLKRKVSVKPPPPPPPIVQPTNPSGSAPTNYASMLDAISSDVYLIRATKVQVTLPDGTIENLDMGWTGTGFLLADGRFVTARHVIQSWFYLNPQQPDEMSTMINIVASNGGKVRAEFEAVSESRKKLTFTSDQFKSNSSGDRKVMKEIKGQSILLTLASLNGGTDWTTARLGEKGKINHSNSRSSSLKRGDRLYILGYPFGTSLQTSSKLQAMYSESSVGQNGLVNGLINITDRGFDSGNSGGPAFYIENGKVEAVGIISAKMGSIGRIVPISATQ